MKSTDDIFTERFMPLYPRLYAVASAILGNRTEEVADAVQEALVKIWKSGKAMAEVRDPEAYSVTAVRTVAIDILRRRHYSEPLDEVYELSSEPMPDPDSEDFLEWCISQLPGVQQEVLRLSTFESLTNDEIACVTGMSPDNVRQALSRGRKKLRLLYDKYMQP